MLSDTCSVYVVGFALRHFGMSAPSDQPTRNAPPENWGDLKLSEQAIWFNAQLRCMIGGNGDKSACCVEAFWSFLGTTTKDSKTAEVKRPDSVSQYSRRLLG